MFKLSWKVIMIAFVILLFILGVSRCEGFQAGTPGTPCGVDLHSCPNGTQCFNGFCGNTKKPALKPNQLPVFP